LFYGAAALIVHKEIQRLILGQRESLRVYKSGPGSQAMLAHHVVSTGKGAVVIVPGQNELVRAKSLLALLSPEGKDPFWERSWIFLPPFESAAGTDWARRWAALFALKNGNGPKGVVLTLDNLLLKLPPQAVIEREYLYLARGEEISQEEIIGRAVSWGYQRVSMVTRHGEMASRGDILDVYCAGYDHPLRMEFFGDLLESIRLFEPLSQKSVGELDEAVVLPCAPCVLGAEYQEAAVRKWKALWTTGELSKTALNSLQADLEGGKGPAWPGLYYSEPATLGDYLPAESLFMLASAEDLRAKLEEAEWSLTAGLEAVEEQSGWGLPRNALLTSVTGARETWLGKPQILFEELTVGHKKEGEELPEREFGGFEEIFWRRDQIQRPWQTLVQALKEWSLSRHQVLLSFHNDRSRKKFLHLTEEEGLDISLEFQRERKGIFALLSPLSKGYHLEWNQTYILPEDVLQPGRSGARERTRAGAFSGLRTFSEIDEGDLLVHRDYGLSRFGGLVRMNRGEVSNDYLLLVYANEDKLYLPVDRLSLVQKYKGPEDFHPPLDRLGGVRWENAKERAKKAIEKIAQDLVDMYAYRKVAKGYSYGPVGELYREFEATFGFEETPDQATAISDVLQDMEKPSPMDRLVCGDVGFGKTEVAMRAAFRAVLDGKQVAILCPTTVLAEQHYQNFRSRLSEFPVKVAVLSRFVPRQRQTVILQALKRGEVDILIGTHRILSKDIHLPNLGLLILDEEQRFGVKHKERIKAMRQNIDALTLTATPIPRTLQLSLSGIRGLSVIETPPVDRKAVDTALIERDRELLKGIVERELAREGQVFWVNNRVQGLEAVVEYVRGLAPGARVGMAHGQMAERQLEETMHRFWHGELDILVCTSIIESGLDFPKANTLIVDGAQLFGLGQLYQLRGRVGRSERQAYAYFVVPALEGISDKARKRLQVIMDLDYLGAGFQVAMEDLRLRGAGNILGEAQSGHIGKVGLDLFLEMLEQEVQRLKGEPQRVETEPELTIGFTANIPERYIPESKDRLTYYKALSGASTDGEVDGIADEIKDRFGHLPPPLTTFLAVLKLKRIMARLQVLKAELYPQRAVLTWSNGTAVDPARLVTWVEEHKDQARLLPPASLEVRFDDQALAKELCRLRDDLTTLVSGEPMGQPRQ
jgi:transcription-repair coupling factor (superfamily II helicase)